MKWNPERERIEAESRREAHWSLWGPYLSERQWGTVREDYSADGDAWRYLPFEHAHARAYRWGEDGILGVSDKHQRLCFAPALWNGRDRVLKERFFGLSGHQGNHGEDVKELYYFLDNVPSHAYMRALYKYPQAAFPYERLVRENAARDRLQPEFELVDTEIFDDDAYFDVAIEYAKRTPTDLVIKIVATNRGAAAATLHLVPQLWYRNEWSWSEDGHHGSIAHATDGRGFIASHPELGNYRLTADGAPRTLFTENETDVAALFGGTNARRHVKSGIDRAIVHGDDDAVSHDGGSKLGLHYVFELAPGASETVRLHLAEDDASATPYPDVTAEALDQTLAERRVDADRFYAALTPFEVPDDERAVQRAAFAGVLWSKQYYYYVIRDWLRGDPSQPRPPDERLGGRNHTWQHVYADSILSMPDTWEYPWFASWDLAFHTIVLALVDPSYAKNQLLTLEREWYMNPSGQLPAYEWSFSDANPPVQAWAALRVYEIERKMYGLGDVDFLKRVFQKLLMNFTWWVNREDPSGKNVFTGGFMGLDNIGIFDRSEPLPGGRTLIESDSTSWMAVYALDMLAIAIELANHDAAYEDVATKFFEHFLYIANAMNESGNGWGLWDDRDGFYYDQVVGPDGERTPVRVRSLVGLVPLFAVQAVRAEAFTALPAFERRLEWFVAHRPELAGCVASLTRDGTEQRRLLAVVSEDRLKRILAVMFDEDEFLSDHGIRSLSKYHREHPVVLIDGKQFRIDYDPAESRTAMFGGNSNWRGPVWMPINYLIIEALQVFHFYYGDELKVEFPTRSGNMMTLWAIAAELSRRLVEIFTRDADGRRAFNGGTQKFQTDPHFRDLILFYEYFNGDDGAGVGASHQTGWTSLVAKLVQQTAEYEAAPQ